MKHEAAPPTPMTKAEMEAEMRRHHAEQIVRDAIGKTPSFEREVKRVMAELKAVEQGAAKRMGKGSA